MQHLFALLPKGEEYDFGQENAEIAASLSGIERDAFVNSLVITEMIQRVGAGNVGEIALHYEIRDASCGRLSPMFESFDLGIAIRELLRPCRQN